MAPTSTSPLIERPPSRRLNFSKSSRLAQFLLCKWFLWPGTEKAGVDFTTNPNHPRRHTEDHDPSPENTLSIRVRFLHYRSKERTERLRENSTRTFDLLDQPRHPKNLSQTPGERRARFAYVRKETRLCLFAQRLSKRDIRDTQAQTYHKPDAGLTRREIVFDEDACIA